MSQHIKAELQTIEAPQKTLNNTAEVVKRYGMALTSFSGRSMYPMLRYETDKILVVKSSGPYKRNQIILYPGNEGKFILHRIIKIKNSNYIIRGDNNLFKEYGINDEMVIGVLKGFYRGKKYIDCDKSIGYKWYVFIWTHTFCLRWFYKKCIYPTYHLGIKILSKIKHMILR